MQLKQEKEYFTYADYCTWDDEQGQRWELIDGAPYMMASPSTKHQDVSGNLVWKFREHLHGKKCKAFAELDVRLNWDKADDIVFRPDLLVVCEPEKIGENFIKGAPDLVIEILSPSTAGRDMMAKFSKYHQAGVKELWYADPVAQTVLVHKWKDGNHSFALYDNTDKITVGILPELIIDMKDIFDDEVGQ